MKSYKMEQFSFCSCISMLFFQLLFPVSLFLSELLHETFLPPSLHPSPLSQVATHTEAGLF